MSAQVLLTINKTHDESTEIVSFSPNQLPTIRTTPPLTRSDAIDDASTTTTSGSSSNCDSPVILYRDASPTNSTESRDSITLKHYDSLLGEIRCPGCARPMHAPIYLCKSGHSACDLCCETLCHCPLCKKDFTKIRSVTLEALAEKAYFLCKYSVHGCTVRLPYHLMRWHKERCVYQVGDCFMGKVWGGCTWSGCEIDWLKHCTDYHAERLFAAEEAQLRWLYPLNGKERGKSVMGFYIFQAFGETFNLYHIYDRLQAKSKWTMVCASKRDEKAFRSFAFQVELFDPEDASRLLMQRHGCHGERDEDVLEEARCVCIDLGEVMRFMTADKILYYRVQILDIRQLQQECQYKSIIRSESVRENPLCPTKRITCADELQINECTNHKNIPTENIIKRRSTDLSRMIATIEEELTDSGSEQDIQNNRKAATVNTNGPIVVHDHVNSGSAVYSVCETKGGDRKCPEEPRPPRRNSKGSLLVGGYDSVKRMLLKTMSVDRSINSNGGSGAGHKIQKPPRKFLTLTNRRSNAGEFDGEDSVSLNVRRSGSLGDLSPDTCSLPDKIPATPPPRKTGKKATSFINLMKSNLKF